MPIAKVRRKGKEDRTRSHSYLKQWFETSGEGRRRGWRAKGILKEGLPIKLDALGFNLIAIECPRITRARPGCALVGNSESSIDTRSMFAGKCAIRLFILAWRASRLFHTRDRGSRTTLRLRNGKIFRTFDKIKRRPTTSADPSIPLETAVIPIDILLASVLPCGYFNVETFFHDYGYLERHRMAVKLTDSFEYQNTVIWSIFEKVKSTIPLGVVR